MIVGASGISRRPLRLRSLPVSFLVQGEPTTVEDEVGTAEGAIDTSALCPSFVADDTMLQAYYVVEALPLLDVGVGLTTPYTAGAIGQYCLVL